ncbi:hypothetical protein V1478_006665, partial [Vespula squamosa]
MHEACNVNAQPAKVQAPRRTMILEGSRVRWIMASQSRRWLRGTGERHRAEGAVATAGQQRAAHGKQLRAGAEEPTGHGILLILWRAKFFKWMIREKPLGQWFGLIDVETVCYHGASVPIERTSDRSRRRVIVSRFRINPVRFKAKQLTSRLFESVASAIRLPIVPANPV